MIELTHSLSRYIPCKLASDIIKDHLYDHEHPWYSMSPVRWYRWIDVVELYLVHCLIQLEHVRGRIAGGNTFRSTTAQGEKPFFEGFWPKGRDERVTEGTIR